MWKWKLKKRSNFFSFLLITLIIPVSGCNHNGDNFFSATPTPLIPEEILGKVKEGDILLRQGQGPFSEKIVEYMGEKNGFSHCGLVVKLNGKLTIIHSVSEIVAGHDGVQTQGIRAFASDIADSVFCIVRPKADKVQQQEMIRLAKLYLESKIPFDYDYDTADSTRLYCSEFLYYTTGQALGKHIFAQKDCGDVSVVYFDSFVNPEYFEVIYSLKPLVH